MQAITQKQPVLLQLQLAIFSLTGQFLIIAADFYKADSPPAAKVIRSVQQ